MEEIWTGVGADRAATRWSEEKPKKVEKGGGRDTFFPLL